MCYILCCGSLVHVEQVPIRGIYAAHCVGENIFPAASSRKKKKKKEKKSTVEDEIEHCAGGGPRDLNVAKGPINESHSFVTFYGLRGVMSKMTRVESSQKFEWHDMTYEIRGEGRQTRREIGGVGDSRIIQAGKKRHEQRLLNQQCAPEFP
ncbi:hypothetical protein BGW80DRAFT_656327 [Lactifluus volemus]|nr:hypothetical protein BGW80DRAFT_656327 [Lactifluus volemus]